MNHSTGTILDLFRRKVIHFGGAAQTARALGCTRAYVDMIRRGTRRPGMRVAHAIERLFGIPMQAWLQLPPASPSPPHAADDASA